MIALSRLPVAASGSGEEQCALNSPSHPPRRLSDSLSEGPGSTTWSDGVVQPIITQGARQVSLTRLRTSRCRAHRASCRNEKRRCRFRTKWLGGGVCSPSVPCSPLSALAVVLERLACHDVLPFMWVGRFAEAPLIEYWEGVLHVWGFRTVFSFSLPTTFFPAWLPKGWKGGGSCCSFHQ